MIYKFRIILDDERTDVFRDIEIESTETLEDLHYAIVEAFEFDGKEMASFYKSDQDWNQGDEISLFEMEGVALMVETTIEEVVNKENRNLLYVYDFQALWTFFVELFEVKNPQEGITYPCVVGRLGYLPNDAPEKDFGYDDFDDDFNGTEFDQDEFDEIYGYNEENF